MIFETVKNTIRASRLLLLFTVLCGGIYPLFVTAVGKIVFPDQANGSLIVSADKVVGSKLIAQKFTLAKYFHSRPSATDFATIPSGASNQSPTSRALKEAILQRENTYGKDAPSDLLTASASGLDPHISPQNARAQLGRIIAARGLDEAKVQTLLEIVANNTEQPTFGFLGNARVNVLTLNMQVDRELP